LEVEVMLEKWYNFKDTKPTIHDTEYEDKTSDQVLWYIDGNIYIGVYIEESIWSDDLNSTYESKSIELGTYGLSSLCNKLISNIEHIEQGTFEGVLYDSMFDKHEIYWSPIDKFDIILRIDLLKKEEEDRKNAVTT
jgi:hypothetical protein